MWGYEVLPSQCFDVLLHSLDCPTDAFSQQSYHVDLWHKDNYDVVPYQRYFQPERECISEEKKDTYLSHTEKIFVIHLQVQIPIMNSIASMIASKARIVHHTKSQITEKCTGKYRDLHFLYALQIYFGDLQHASNYTRFTH